MGERLRCHAVRDSSGANADLLLTLEGAMRSWPARRRISRVTFWNWIGRSNEEIVQFRKDWMEGTRYGEVKGYDGPRIPAPQLRPVPLKARGRVR
ncbi:hypothetical protein Sros01_03540 [Streptomyces roseochromogenus]|nr:hypothetical protein Sros01_03540 [Streptomyces roseochromogenus]